MQEEVDEKTMALVITGGKISASVLKDALAKLVRQMEEKRRLTRTEKREEKRAQKAAAEKAKENESRPGGLAFLFSSFFIAPVLCLSV